MRVKQRAFIVQDSYTSLSCECRSRGLWISDGFWTGRRIASGFSVEISLKMARTLKARSHEMESTHAIPYSSHYLGRNSTRTVTLCTRSPLVLRHVIQSFATMPTPLRGLDCRRNLSEAPGHWDEPLRIARAAKALIHEHNLVTDHAMHVSYTPSSHARKGTFHPSSR